eukprot:3420599-Pyramimonas_sp.AAC.1
MFRRRESSEAAQRLLIGRVPLHPQKHPCRRDVPCASKTGRPWSGPWNSLPRRPCWRDLDLRVARVNLATHAS